MTESEIQTILLKQAMQAHQDGKLAEAEKKLHALLRQNPNNSTAYHELGLIAYHAADYETAISLMQRALAISPYFVAARSNLARVLIQQKRFDAAQRHLQVVLKAQPRFAEAYFNLGLIDEKRGNVTQAITHFQQSIHLKPDYPPSYYEWGRVLYNSGREEESVPFFQKTLSLNPNHPPSLIFLALHAWIHGEIAEMERHLTALAPDQFTDTFSRPYHLFLSRLLHYRSKNTELYNEAPEAPPLHFIGESHCLTSAHLPLSFSGQMYRAQPALIVGCKAWHLGNGQDNSYKHHFSAIIDRIPRKSPILLLFGEIDCRHNEGIPNNIKKTGCSVDEAVAAVVPGYVDFILQNMQRKSLYPMFCGVQAPSLARALESSDRILVADVIRSYNQFLQRETEQRELFFLDLFSATNDADGHSSGKLFIDDYHLLPSLVIELLQKESHLASIRKGDTLDSKTN